VTVPEFTLIVPTFNRPRDLARLLTYLVRQKAEFPVLVLDSSDGETKVANAGLIDHVELDVRLVSYASSITPFEKFWRGSQEVRTEFCSLCADDDVLMLDAILPLVNFLQEHPDFSAAHGLYFTFYDNVHIGITSIVYSGGSFGRDDPLLRFLDFFRRYEAVTYALYRAEVMRYALAQIQAMQSMLARELLAGALTVVAGKVARLPIVYYGRSLHPSVPYQHWHPIDFLISSPQALFEDYAKYRRTLLESFDKNGASPETSVEVLKIIDLVHLRYLVDYVSPTMMDYLLEQVLAGRPPAEIMLGVWPRLSANDAPTLKRLWSSRTLRRFRERLVPSLRQYHLRWLLRTAQNQTVNATTFSGRPREYRLYEAFLSALARMDSAGSAVVIDGILREMNAYE
jgi:glycosyltransferase domain-containing protein